MKHSTFEKDTTAYVSTPNVLRAGELQENCRKAGMYGDKIFIRE
jgi:hypothetical protein